MQIRNLQKDDAPQIRALVAACGNYVIPYQTYAYWVLESYFYSTCLVMEHEDKVIGYLSSVPSPDREVVFLWQICVAAEYRKSKIGSQLLDRFGKICRQQGHQKMEVTIAGDNIPSQKLFASFAKRHNTEFETKKKLTIGGEEDILFSIQLT